MGEPLFRREGGETAFDGIIASNHWSTAMIGDELLKSQDVLIPAFIEGMLLVAGNAFQSAQFVFAKPLVVCCGTLGADPHG